MYVSVQGLRRTYMECLVAHDTRSLMEEYVGVARRIAREKSWSARCIRLMRNLVEDYSRR